MPSVETTAVGGNGDAPREKSARDRVRGAFQQSVLPDPNIRPANFDKREYLYELLEQQLHQYAGDAVMAQWFQMLVNTVIAMPWPPGDGYGGPEWQQAAEQYVSAAVAGAIRQMQDP